MNKSLATNLLAAFLAIVGYLLPESTLSGFLLTAGLFALSGAFTNWLAVHMLFEKVPGFYGSGVIQDRFEDFKCAILTLVMENFFNEENFRKFADAALHQGMGAKTIEEQVDMDEVFEGFLNVIVESKFGGMLGMFGGIKALEPLRAPFKVEMSAKLKEIIENLDLTKGQTHYDSFLPTVQNLVKGKLDELKAPDVKRIIEEMIRAHLGWLVVWGGVCGALIGLISAALI